MKFRRWLSPIFLKFIRSWSCSGVAFVSITLLNNIFLGVQSLYRRCPNLQGMETRLSCQEKCDFLHRHGVRCYARARVELVQIAFTARAPPITTSLFRKPWQPLTPYATFILGYAAVNVQRSCRRERRFGICSLNEKCSLLSVRFCLFCQFSSAWRHCFCPLATQLSTVLST